MKTCDDCKYAEWKRTAAGRLHPKKGGWCVYDWKMPPLPKAKYWIHHEPKPSGGHITRGEELADHCAYWARKEAGR